MASRLGLDEARAVVEAVLNAAAARDLRFAAAVVDSGGELVYSPAWMERARSTRAWPSIRPTPRRSGGRRPRRSRIGCSTWRWASTGGHRLVRDSLYRRVGRHPAGWPGRHRTGRVGESGGTPVQDEELGQIGAQAFAAF